ncbi:PAS domain-containing protein [Flavobacterium helocola]|uniref:PAS domain-containing protein n=1 Tax=Flavobacterium helocola TaxID=3139139 RepID=A0ABU9I777_9FLAO
MKNYELAIAKYYSKLKIIPTPLISWDIFSSQQNEILFFNSFQKEWKSKEHFFEIVHKQKKSVIITNSHFEIVFATENIIKMNGYFPSEIVGKSPKIFQGSLTSDITKEIIKEAIISKKPFKEVILNYKKDGSTYFCEIEAYPKFNQQGNFINYIAFERKAS